MMKNMEEREDKINNWMNPMLQRLCHRPRSIQLCDLVIDEVSFRSWGFEVQISIDIKIVGDFFSFILILMDKAIGYILLVGGTQYLIELVKVHIKWPRYYSYQNESSKIATE